MPRASRYMKEGWVYHLTHRCHDRRFLLKFKKERDTYREWLRVGVQRYAVSVYAFCITSNHVHVVVDVDDTASVARLMQLPAGVVAQALNRRKGHGDSIWEHPYHCTMIENGTHLLRCLRYVDLNMVRAGKVTHPQEWRWCGYDELTGQRQRYRILDVQRLSQRLGLPDTQTLFKTHMTGIREQLLNHELEREPHWTEAVAVGTEEFVRTAELLQEHRRKFARYPIETLHNSFTWAVREAESGYN